METIDSDLSWASVSLSCLTNCFSKPRTSKDICTTVLQRPTSKGLNYSFNHSTLFTDPSMYINKIIRVTINQRRHTMVESSLLRMRKPCFFASSSRGESVFSSSFSTSSLSFSFSTRSTSSSTPSVSFFAPSSDSSLFEVS